MTSERGTCLKSATIPMKIPCFSRWNQHFPMVFLWFPHEKSTTWNPLEIALGRALPISTLWPTSVVRDVTTWAGAPINLEMKKIFNNLHDIHNNIHNMHTIFTSYYICPCIYIYIHTYASNHIYIYIYMYAFKSLRYMCIDMFTYGKGLFVFW